MGLALRCLPDISFWIPSPLVRQSILINNGKLLIFDHISNSVHMINNLMMHMLICGGKYPLFLKITSPKLHIICTSMKLKTCFTSKV